MSHYYNEFNPESAAMLRQMMKDGIIPAGIVDERSITEIKADELNQYTQCHFFAGIGGWAIALRLAGWPADREVWTGSCPCQPFSTAGQQRGKEDDRHLWPVWEKLIKECRPAAIFGEQVANAITKGWLDDVYEGLEPEGYAIGSAVLPAVGVGAPHKRDRLWFVGYLQHHGQVAATQFGSYAKKLSHPAERENSAIQFERTSLSGLVAYNDSIGYKRQGQLLQPVYSTPGEIGQADQFINASAGMWDSDEWVICPDGKARLIEPGIQLLAHGFQHREPILHAIGNAIVPQVAAEFIKASMYY